MFEMANNDSKIQPENRKAAKSLYYLLYEGFNQTTSSHKIFFIKKKKNRNYRVGTNIRITSNIPRHKI